MVGIPNPLDSMEAEIARLEEELEDASKDYVVLQDKYENLYKDYEDLHKMHYEE